MVESVSSCDRALNDERLVRYLRDALPEDEREEFEVHLLECDECSELLEAAAVAREVIEDDGVPARRARPVRIVPMASLAAGLAAAAAATFLLLRPQAAPVVPTTPPRVPVEGTLPSATAPAPTAAPREPAGELAELARVEPPTYLPLTTRAPATTDAAFDLAMAHYARREYAPAAEGLRAVVRERPSAGEAWFFLGLSELMAGRAREARASLARAALLGQPPYAGAAVFFGAKAELRLGEADAARRALRDAVAGGGPYAAEARRLLERLDRLGAKIP